MVSLVLQLFALVTPMFFQVVMDKVLVHKGFSTLDVIAMGLLVVVTFEVILTGLRSYVFSHTTSRMDVELGAALFRHLLHLPLAINGEAETKAIQQYQQVIELAESLKDYTTRDILKKILADEEQHLSEINDFIKDINSKI